MDKKVTSSNEKFGKLYDTSAKFGKIFALIALIFSIIFGIFLIITGISLLLKEPSHLTESTEGKVTEVKGECTEHIVDNDIIYTCSITVVYNIGENGKKYVKQFTTNSKTKYRKGDEITIHYNPNNPNESSIGTQISPKTSGILSIIIGVLCILLGVLYYYFIKKNDEMAALLGMAEIMKIFVPFGR
jgi:predicted permease